MLGFLKAASRRFAYVPVHMQRGEMLSLTSAAGFELQADASALWVTADGEPRDIFLSPGERFRIGAHRHVLISADHPATVTVAGQATRATTIEIIRANGEHVRAYPSRTTPEREEAPIWTPDPVARRVRRPGIVSPLTPAALGLTGRLGSIA